MSYYEQYIAALENGEQVVATFEFDGSVYNIQIDGSVYNIQIVNKNSLLTVTPPTSTAYVIFNGWTVNDEPIDLETFRITENTKIVADVTHKYEVNFMVDGENYHNEIVVKDSHITPPAEPQKAGYVFDGWTIGGNAVVDFETYTVTQNVTFTAKFVKLYSVVFKYEETTLSTQTVKSGECKERRICDCTRTYHDRVQGFQRLESKRHYGQCRRIPHNRRHRFRCGYNV